MSRKPILKSELQTFSKNFDTSYEDRAVAARGNFLQAYPIQKLKSLSIEEYVIGKGTASFCACVEVKTKAWASIQGATANKFGIYYGKKKSDPKMQYRYTMKFGKNKNEAFNAVKYSLLNLIEAGKSLNFREIDNNPLSQMFKAKILSLYFPGSYLNICSSEHIKKIAMEMNIPEKKFISEYQHLLLKEKLKNNFSKDWSNPKFMSFLYAKFIRGDLIDILHNAIKPPRKKVRRKVNFEEISANRDAIGKASEKFAIDWEKNRLIGLGYTDLVNKIEDKRDIPSYGYDYLSYHSPGHKRYIEVKSVGRDRKEDCYRFYLSENERTISITEKISDDYYFYLVFFDKNGEPFDVLAIRAKEFYLESETTPCAYIVRFDMNKININP
ncbi:DUF3883 domain-containing protein [Halomonas sp. KO116]|uniref:DUF3883 domain-containing protein n=1 Tax=Halomonas sp. KO116 TaxID=1504981 RepID=UPI0004E37C9F|nr:DUF3883 domain-containing protein [Halomonas sp. KO116]AJY50062.1 protein of unknown function DUF3883 [Halomonas sp. KO116]